MTDASIRMDEIGPRLTGPRRTHTRQYGAVSFAAAAAIGNGLLGGDMEALTKPFAVDALAARVQAIIGD